MNPNRVKKAIVTEPLAALNRRSREQPDIEHRVGGAALPGDEQAEEDRGGNEARRRPARSQPASGASMIV